MRDYDELERLGAAITDHAGAASLELKAPTPSALEGLRWRMLLGRAGELAEEVAGMLIDAENTDVDRRERSEWEARARTYIRWRGHDYLYAAPANEAEERHNRELLAELAHADDEMLRALFRGNWAILRGIHDERIVEGVIGGDLLLVRLVQVKLPEGFPRPALASDTDAGAGHGTGGHLEGIHQAPTG